MQPKPSHGRNNTESGQWPVSFASACCLSRSTHQALADERNAMIEIYINGDFFRETKPRSPSSIRFLVGDGIWEGIRSTHGVFAHLDRHLDRLFAGAAAIALDIGLDRDGVEAALRQLSSATTCTTMSMSA